ncbi:acylphosphatase [Candidatus Woesearchaeota archaeon]|nr:acylphosphatase [Candidatus Woesearchaeota archaeon]
MKCTHLIVSGRVQGVFFRANVRDKALQLRLKGYAKNLESGDVEVVAEGDEKKINELVDFIKKGPGIASVTGVQVKHKEPESFKNFEVRR